MCFFFCVSHFWSYSLFSFLQVLYVKASCWWCHAFTYWLLSGLCVLRARSNTSTNLSSLVFEVIVVAHLHACFWIKISWKSTLYFIFSSFFYNKLYVFSVFVYVCHCWSFFDRTRNNFSWTLFNVFESVIVEISLCETKIWIESNAKWWVLLEVELNNEILLETYP